ncbi:hydroxyacid dehydrogenase [Gordonia sp. ABSL11-1]|uniref:NAD(P)-dependent oxidoreductase n=1 Tax=Gordonia sp. ABSL11-1 TaxID=3053924 RepID=UPI002572A8E9|nr:hydroxyacid dehydrogenase [Gordonia sp. ABSL11-1]MDL9947218.1 hydroxyacid dehydrogenase [Gordonia sp. ABSL11-1]
MAEQQRTRVLVVDPIAPSALEQLGRAYDVSVSIRPEPDKLMALVFDTDAIVMRSGVELTADTIERAPKLRVIARAGAGTDNIDLDACRRADICVFNIPGASANAVAELALGLVLALTRNIARSDRHIRTGFWDKQGSVGPELASRSVGIIGLGRIGTRLADIFTALGALVLGSLEHPTRERDSQLAARGVTRVSTDELLHRSDFVFVTVPLTPCTHHLIGAPELRAMPKHAYLINVSRGGVIDEHALERALRSGSIAGAALDVHNREWGTPPLAELDNVVLTPHIGAGTVDAQRRVGTILIERLAEALSGRPVDNRIV